ncbi:MAG: hypothetical protein NTY12_02320 [Candidatus Falkowbacteria bacterium]|nr:hypothetical protein [Candidatus Falkowbacteria bacterium]
MISSGNSQRTIEKLNHFSCSFCSKWWTVGDAPENKVEWYCPWCGEKNDFKQIAN